MGKIVYKVNTDDLMKISENVVGSRSKNKRKQKEFLDHISASTLFREIKKGNMKKYTFFFKNKYQNALSNLKDKVTEEYETWNEEYLIKRNRERIKQLESQNIPLKCSSLAVPVIPTVAEHERLFTTCINVLNSILNYCDKFDRTKPKNMVENIICDVYIKRLGNFCKRASTMLDKSRDANPVEAQNIRKKIVTKLCFGNDLNIQVGLFQVSTRLKMLMNDLAKAQKIEDPEKQFNAINNALNELITNYPESKKYTRDFVEERFVEFRRSAKVFCKYLDDKLQPALTALVAILKPLAKVDPRDIIEVTEEEKIEKENRQNQKVVN